MEKKAIFSWVALISGVLTIVLSTIAISNHTKKHPKLAGAWTMTFTVEESSYKPYINDVSVYEVYVTQSKEGNELSGEGEQKRYNGNYAKKRFKMKFTHGTIKKNEVTVCYNLYGSRPTEGIIMLTIDPKNDKRLTGRFSGSAANTKGSVEVLIL